MNKMRFFFNVKFLFYLTFYLEQYKNVLQFTLIIFKVPQGGFIGPLVFIININNLALVLGFPNFFYK